MRSRKELICLNIETLTTEEKEKLSDYELNACDICGEIDLSENLNWIDGEIFWENDTTIRLVKEGNVAVCDDCLEKETEKDKEKWKRYK